MTSLFVSWLLILLLLLLVVELVFSSSTTTLPPCETTLSVAQKKERYKQRVQARDERHKQTEGMEETGLQAHLRDEFVAAMVDEEALLEIVDAQLRDQLPPIVIQKAKYEIYDFDFKISIYTPQRLKTETLRESFHDAEVYGGPFRVSKVVGEEDRFLESLIFNPYILTGFMAYGALVQILWMRCVYMFYLERDRGSYTEKETWLVVYIANKMFPRE